MTNKATAENPHNNLKTVSIFDISHLSGIEATISSMPNGREVPGDQQASGEDIDVKYKGPPVSEHFKFEAVREVEFSRKSATSSTPTVDAGIASLAEQLGMKKAELIRRAVFAADANPAALFSHEVEKREAAFRETSNTHGGAGRSRGRPKATRIPN